MSGQSWVGAVLLGVILSTWMASRADNRKAHEKIGENIKGVKTELKADIKGVEGKVDVLTGDIKELNRSAGRLEGSLGTTGRPSETRQD